MNSATRRACEGTGTRLELDAVGPLHAVMLQRDCSRGKWYKPVTADFESSAFPDRALGLVATEVI
jgi:hypothetical protein